MPDYGRDLLFGAFLTPTASPPHRAVELVAAALNATIDGAAVAAGRDPAVVRRLLNISGTFTDADGGLLQGPPRQWARELARIAVDYGTSGFLLATDSAEDLARFGQDVAPEVRALVAAARTG